MVWPFKSTSEALFRIQWSLNRQWETVNEILLSTARIEAKLNGHIPPKLLRAIVKLNISADALAALIKTIESKRTASVWRGENVVANEGTTTMAADLSDEIAIVEKTNGVVKSATVLISGFQSKLDEAVTDAIANGATAEQLQPLSDLSLELEASTDALAAAVAANTPAE